jgi:hypothetical protein
MTTSLRPTPTRLALLQAVADRQVSHYRAKPDRPAQSRHGHRAVSDAMRAMEMAGWVERGTFTGKEMEVHATADWKLTAASRAVLDAATRKD